MPGVLHESDQCNTSALRESYDGDTLSGMQKPSTSFRFDERFVALLDAWAEHVSIGRYRPATRTEVVFSAVKRMKPPTEPGETQSKVRAAYNATFDYEPPADGDTRAVCEHPQVDFNGTMKICRDCKKMIR